MSKITYRCPECGSENVGADAFVFWNEDAQCWNSTQTPYDSMTCLDCGHEADYGFQVELEE